MNKTLKRFLILVCVILAIGIAIYYYTRPKPLLVLVKKVERGIVESTVANTRAGTVKSCRRAYLSPEVGGQISKLPVREGMKVEAGTLLLSLWNEDRKTEVQLAKSEVAAARASAEAACLQADIAARQARRFEELKKTGAVSEEQLDQTLTTAKSSRAQCEAARASVKVSTEREKVARARLERTMLIAPFDGIIAEVNGEVGEYVTPSPPGIATLPAIDLVDVNCYYVSAPIDEVDAPAIRIGMEARVTLDAFANRDFPGTVRRIADYVLDREKQARTVDIEVEFTEKHDMKDLLPGYSADAEVILGRSTDVLRVPSEAVVDNKKVFVFLPDIQKLEERQVETGLSNWEYTEINNGVAENEEVVISVDREGVKDGVLAQIEEPN